MGIAADHMRRFRRDTGDRVMDTTTLLGNFRTRQVNDTFLRVVHHGHPCRNTLADNRTGSQCTVAVEDFNPVVIGDTQLFGIGFTQPDHRTTAT